MWMSVDGQGIKCRKNIAEIFNPLSRAHKRYRRQTETDSTDGRQQRANVNVNSRSLKSASIWRNYDQEYVHSFDSPCRPRYIGNGTRYRHSFYRILIGLGFVNMTYRVTPFPMTASNRRCHLTYFKAFKIQMQHLVGISCQRSYIHSEP